MSTPKTLEPKHFYDNLWSQSGWRGAVRLGPANRMRHELLKRKLLKIVSRESNNSLSLCDFGCGDGALLESLAQDSKLSALKFLGCDISEANPSQTFFKFQQGDLSNHGFKLPELVDIAVCSEVLEHLNDPEQALINMAANLKPGGTVLLSVPSGPVFSFDKAVGHLRHFDSKLLTAQMRKAGFTKIKVTKHGFPFHSFYKTAAHFLPASKQKKLMALKEPSLMSRLALTLLYKALLLSKIPWCGFQILAVGEKA